LSTDPEPSLNVWPMLVQKFHQPESDMAHEILKECAKCQTTYCIVYKAQN